MTASVRLNATRRRDFQCGSIWGGDRSAIAPVPAHVWDHWRGMMPPSIPIATYRLQLTADFGFDNARGARSLSEGHRNKSPVFFAIS